LAYACHSVVRQAAGSVGSESDSGHTTLIGQVFNDLQKQFFQCRSVGRGEHAVVSACAGSRKASYAAWADPREASDTTPVDSGDTGAGYAAAVPGACSGYVGAIVAGSCSDCDASDIIGSADAGAGDMIDAARADSGNVAAAAIRAVNAADCTVLGGVFRCGGKHGTLAGLQAFTGVDAE
jgi:hypothetical protein